MNTDNLKQQNQQLFGEPQFVEGTAGKKEVYGEPQFITGREKHAEQLTPLYTQPQHGVGDPNKIPGTKGTEHLPSTEHVHLTPTEQVHLTPDAGHVHIKAGNAPEAGVDQVIRVKPDGRIQVTAEKAGEHLKEHTHSTEHLRKEHVTEKLSTEHKKEHGHGTELKTEHSTGHRKDEALHKPSTSVEHETEHLHTKESKKKRLSGKGKHQDTVTQTIVKISEHEPGTAGYRKDEKLGKHGHDDTHHRDIDTHHRDTDATKVKVDKAHGTTEHVNVTTGKGAHVHDVHDTEHLKTGKTSSKKEKHASDKTKHHHGTDETKVTVDKDKQHHGDDTSDKTKHHHGDYDTSDKTKHHHGTDETKVTVDKDKHHHGDDTSDKTKHHRGTDETKVIVKDKDRHGSGETAVKVTDRDHDLKKHHTDTTTHVKAGTLSKPQEVHDRTESQYLLQSLRTTLNESDTPNLDLIGELLQRAEVFLSKSAMQPNIDP